MSIEDENIQCANFSHGGRQAPAGKRFVSNRATIR